MRRIVLLVTVDLVMAALVAASAATALANDVSCTEPDRLGQSFCETPYYYEY
jgi:hypothetical protein